MTRDEVVRRLEARHREFFQEMAIDPQTGCTDRFPGSNRRFATYPYVGSRYGERRRILFIGLDIGTDPKSLLDFKERRCHIEDKKLRCHNPHIAGTWCVALSLLPPEFGWDEIADSEHTCRQILRRYPESHWKANPLSFCGLTNFYKWVTIGRGKAGGAQDRVHLSREIERRFLTEEIAIFRPQVVVFQSAEFRNPKHLELVELVSRELPECDVRVVKHPSLRGRGGRPYPREVTKVLYPSRA